MILPDEYVLTLATGERIEVSEFAYERIPFLTSELLAAIPDVLRGCAVLSRDSVEAAKLGHDADLRRTVKEPVVGLMKVARPECDHVGTCVMADRRFCTARNVSRKKRIPPCWEHGSEGDVRELVSAVVLAWAAGRRVIVVVPDPRSLQGAPVPGVRPSR